MAGGTPGQAQAMGLGGFPAGQGAAAKNAWANQQAMNSPANQFMQQNQGNMVGAFNALNPTQQFQMLSGNGGNQVENSLINGGMSQIGLGQFINQGSYANAGNNPYLNQAGSPQQLLGSAQSFGGTAGWNKNPTF